MGTKVTDQPANTEKIMHICVIWDFNFYTDSTGFS